MLLDAGWRILFTFTSFAHTMEQVKGSNSFFRTKVCEYFLKGHCKLGDNCRYAHDRSQMCAFGETVEKESSSSCDDGSCALTKRTSSLSTCCSEQQQPQEVQVPCYIVKGCCYVPLHLIPQFYYYYPQV